MSPEPHIYAWSLSGALTWSGTLREFAALHDIEPRPLFAELLVLQATVGRDPEPLRLALPGGDVLLTLTPQIGPAPSVH